MTDYARAAFPLTGRPPFFMHNTIKKLKNPGAPPISKLRIQGAII